MSDDGYDRALLALVDQEAETTGRRRRQRRNGEVALIPGQMHLTDTGNAKRMVAMHRDRLRFCPPRRKWLVWDGRRWRVDETGEVMRLAKATAAAIWEEGMDCEESSLRERVMKHAHRSEAAARLSAMVTLAESEPGIPVMPSELDSDPWLLNVANGTLDLRTGELREHRRDDLITKLAPAEYVPGATSELWESFLSTATGGDAELQAYLARVVGYSLQGTAREKAFFFFFGPPDTSKSTFIDAVAGAMGDYHAAAAFDTWLVQTATGGNRGDLVSLAGSRMVTSVEVRPNVKFDTALVKRVTGGDLLKYAAKFEHEVEFAPQFTIVLAANDAPAIYDDDDGMWSRVRRIPFNAVIPAGDRDPFMREKLSADAVRSAILSWAVDGCKAWLSGGLGTCKAVQDSTEEYHASQDRCGGFFRDCCWFGPHVRIATKSLTRAYLSWCEEENVRAISGKEFAARLRKRGCRDAKSNGVRYWSGVRLLEDDEDRQAGTSGSAGDICSRDFPKNVFHEGSYEELVSPGATGVPSHDDVLDWLDGQ